MKSRHIVGVVNAMRGTTSDVLGRLRAPLAPGPRLVLIVLLAAGALTALAFGLYPQLDLTISALFYDTALHDWPANQHMLLTIFRDINTYLAFILVSIAIAVAAIAAIRGRELRLMSRRAAWFLIWTVVLGPGLIVNVLLKPEWGRPRPAEVIRFGGKLDFVPWWDPFGACGGNCSFVSGEESLAMWMLAFAIVLPPRYRVAAITVAALNCVAIGLCRIAMGGHFASDVLFAAIFTALAALVAHIAVFGAATTNAAASSAPRQGQERAAHPA
jgi:membrane-associated PAP2 superfamily phosphatase